MVYPALLSCVGLGSIFILMYFVVPRFALIFADGRIRIPAPTQIMLDGSYYVKTYWWIAASALACALVFWRLYTATAAGRLWWDRARLRIPLLGDALLKAETARFARAMATLLANTVPLVQAIAISAATLNNRLIASAMTRRAGREARRRHRRAAPQGGRFPRWPPTC